MIIGKCSICGGSVEVPDVWYGIDPPKGTCRNCGAIKRDDLPEIDMEPRVNRDRWKEMIKEITGG